MKHRVTRANRRCITDVIGDRLVTPHRTLGDAHTISPRAPLRFAATALARRHLAGEAVGQSLFATSACRAGPRKPVCLALPRNGSVTTLGIA